MSVIILDDIFNQQAGGIIVVLQTLIFLLAFVFAPKHGLLAARKRAREAIQTENVQVIG